jgi:hypothetical protein
MKNPVKWAGIKMYQLTVALDLCWTLVTTYLGRRLQRLKRRRIVLWYHWATWLLWARAAAKQHHWWEMLDHLLHAVEYPIPDCVLEFAHWRTRFCTWATLRYDGEYE